MTNNNNTTILTNNSWVHFSTGLSRDEMYWAGTQVYAFVLDGDNNVVIDGDLYTVSEFSDTEIKVVVGDKGFAVFRRP